MFEVFSLRFHFMCSMRRELEANHRHGKVNITRVVNPVDNTRQPDNDKFKNTFHLACAGSNLTLQTI